MTVKFKSYESTYFKGSSGLHTVSPTGLWLKEVTENKEYVINSSHYSPNERKLLNVKIFEFDNNDNFLRRIDSNTVLMFKDKWDLYDVKVVELNKIPLEFSKMRLIYQNILMHSKNQVSTRINILYILIICYRIL